MPGSVVPLEPRPPEGRVFSNRRQVRLGDVRPTGELRLDALTRYTQDVSNDDTTDAALPDDMSWIVRKTTLDVAAPAVFGEVLEISTFCSGLGRRWAERRIQLVGDRGAQYEVASIWVFLDEETGRPRQLSEAFISTYGQAAQGRNVSARLSHTGAFAGGKSMPWPTRLADFDLFDHMNNAAYWACIEELELPPAKPRRHEIEYRAGISRSDDVLFCRSGQTSGELTTWWLAGDRVAATARITELPTGTYDVAGDASSGAAKTASR